MQQLKTKLKEKQQDVGRSKQLLDSFCCSGIDRLCQLMNQWQCQQRSKSSMKEKRLFNRAQLREAQKDAQQYEILASMESKTKMGAAKQGGSCYSQAY